MSLESRVLDKNNGPAILVFSDEGANLWCKPEVGPESGELIMG